MKKNSKPTQCQRLIAYMEKNPDGVTQITALSELGILRLASRISEIRKDGYMVSKEMVSVTNRYGEKANVAKYKLI